jgi:hypothetical protein
VNELRAVRQSLLASRPAFHADVDLYAALVVALEPRSTEWLLARDMLRKAAGPRYPGKAHQVRGMAGQLEKLMEGEDG